MGSPLSSTFTEVIMQLTENSVIPIAPFKLKLYIRYINAVLTEWTHTKQELVRFKEKLKQPFETINLLYKKRMINYHT